MNQKTTTEPPLIDKAEIAVQRRAAARAAIEQLDTARSLLVEVTTMGSKPNLMKPLLNTASQKMRAAENEIRTGERKIRGIRNQAKMAREEAAKREAK